MLSPWHQLIEFHRDLRCGGAPEHKVIESLAKHEGISYQAAASRVEMAVAMRDIRRVNCACN